MSDEDFERRVAGLSERKRLLLRHLKQQQRGGTAPIGPRRPGSTRAPLSQAQEQLWFLSELAPDEPTYNLVQAVRLRGTVDPVAVRRALDEVVRRHEALRTVFESADGQARQVVREPAAADLVLDDLSGVPDGQRLTAARDLIGRHEVHRPFDLRRGPLFRARLVALAGNDHVFCLAAHHSVVDGWSMGLVAREVAALYQAYRDGTAPALSAPGLQYADFAQWQRTHLRDQVMETHLDYWERRLAGLAPLDLPTDRPRPATMSFRGATLEQPLDPQSHPAVQTTAKETGTSAFMLLVAGFAAMLARYTGMADIALGTVLSGRGRPELEGVVGFFANMGVLRLDTTGDPTFATLVERAREACLGAWEHQDAPFEQVVRRLAPPRDPSRNPLFQVALQLLDQSTWGGAALPGTDSAPLELALSRSRFDLTVSVVDHGDRYSMLVEYSTDLFDESRIRRMLSHFERLLAAGLAEPDTAVSRLPLLDDAERERLLSFGSAPALAYPRATVPRLVTETAERHPDAVAVCHDGDIVTYAELTTRARRLAGRLHELGVRRGTLVPSLQDRGRDEVVTLLGVWYAGGVYVPLDTAAPVRRLERILSRAADTVVVTRHEHAGKLPEHAGRWQVLCVDGPDALAGEYAADSGTPDDLAYVLHTSGSTGEPKGVRLDHGALVSFLAWMTAEWGCGPGDRVLHAAAPVFDLGAAEILAALTSGATVVPISRDRLLSPGGLAGVLSRERITHTLLTPTTLSLVPEDPDGFGELRHVMVAGEICPGDLARRWTGPRRRFLNAYGPTEATVAATYADCTGWSASVPPPIGRSLPNRTTYVLDRWGDLAPVGVPGEIVLGGVGVSPGYLREPELTAEKFGPDPFRPTGRVYHTGDLGCWSEDGQLQFIGRRDGQVKLRGLRVELGEIEAALARHPAVDAAAVAVHADPSGLQRLVAYVVAGDAPPDARELRDHLAEDLPAHLVPSHIRYLPALPLTTTGKVDRRALPPPDPDAEAGHPGEDQPQTPAERQVAEAYAKVLGTAPVGAGQSFFDLGGHSLQAALVLARIARVSGVSVSLKDFYAAPTVRAVALRLGEQTGSASRRSPLVSLKAHGSRPTLYCVHAVSGSPYWYLPLTRALHPEQPVEAFEAPGLEGDEEPIDDLVVLCARYVAALRERQPAGPYLLAGWSMGGFVVFEMARQLAATGAGPALVIMVDSNAPGPLPAPAESLVAQTFVNDLAGLSGVEPPRLPAGMAGTAASAGTAGTAGTAGEPAELTRFLVDQSLIPGDVEPSFIANRYAVFRANMRAIYAYRPKRHDGPVVMVRAAQEAARSAWGAYASRFTEVTLPGTHYSMWTPDRLPALAALIDDQIASYPRTH